MGGPDKGPPVLVLGLVSGLIRKEQKAAQAARANGLGPEFLNRR